MDQIRIFGEQISRILEFKPEGLDFQNSRCRFTEFANLIHFGRKKIFCRKTDTQDRHSERRTDIKAQIVVWILRKLAKSLPKTVKKHDNIAMDQVDQHVEEPYQNLLHLFFWTEEPLHFLAWYTKWTLSYNQYKLWWCDKSLEGNHKFMLLNTNHKVEIFLEQREVAFLSPSKICEYLNFSTVLL